jgi:cytochrome c oxidase subunit 2
MNERRQTAEIIAVILLFLGIALFTVIGFATNWLPPVASQHGVGVDGVIRYLLLTTGAILVIGAVVFVAFLWLYGEAGVLIKGLPVWEQVYGEVPEDAVVVEANAQQFEWIIRYPGRDGAFGRTDPALIQRTANPLGLDQDDPAATDDVIIRGALHLPAGRTALVRLRSRDVLHSLSIAAFRVKQDIVPGMVGNTRFVPTRPGRYEIACAEVCGMGHYQMGGSVVVHAPGEFQEWLDDQTGWFQ